MRAVLAVLVAFLGCLLVALLMTGAYTLEFRSDCRHDGGTFHMTRTLLVCHY